MNSKLKNTRAVSGFLRGTTLFLLIFALAFTFTACGQSEGAEAEGETVKLVLINDGDTVEYEVSLSELKAEAKGIDLILHLEEKGKIDIEYTDSTYGAYFTKVGHIEERAADGVYVGFWTNYEADFDVSQYATTIEYDGQNLTSSGVGVSQMNLHGGTVILVGELSY